MYKRHCSSWPLTRLFSQLVLFAVLAYPFTSYAERLNTPVLQRVDAEKSLLLAITQVEQRLIAVGEQGVIVYSDDKGKHWLQAQVPTSTLLTAVKFVDKQHGWAVGHDGVVLSSDDGGSSWKRVLTGNEINQLRAEQLQKLMDNVSASGLSDEQRENLEYQLDDALLAVEEGATQPLLDLLFFDRETGFLIGAYGTLLRTADGGQNWQSIGHQLPNPDGLHLNRIYALSNGQLLILGEAGLLLTSHDKGQSWTAIESPYQGSLFTAVETEHLYLMGLRGNTFRTQLGNPGLDWEKVELPAQATINDALVVDNQLILAGQGGVLLRQIGEQFAPLGERQLRSFTALTQLENTLFVTGETGITRIDLIQEAK